MIGIFGQPNFVASESRKRKRVGGDSAHARLGPSRREADGAAMSAAMAVMMVQRLIIMTSIVQTWSPQAI